MVAAAALIAWALAVAIRDYRARRIDNLVLLAAFLPAVAWLVWHGHGILGQSVRSSCIGFVVAGAVFLPGFALGKSGGGDVKFAAVCGLIAGAGGSLVMMLVAALVIGASSAATYFLGHRPAGQNRRLPAGPAIATGFAVTLLLTLDRS